MTEPAEDQPKQDETGIHWAWWFVFAGSLTWKWFLWAGGLHRILGEATRNLVFVAGVFVIFAFSIFMIFFARAEQRRRQAEANAPMALANGR